MRSPRLLIALAVMALSATLATPALGQTDGGTGPDDTGQTTTSAPATTAPRADSPATTVPAAAPPETTPPPAAAPVGTDDTVPADGSGGDSAPLTGDPNTITVRKAVAEGAPAGVSFTIRLQNCTRYSSFFNKCFGWSDVSSAGLMDGESHEFTGLTSGTRYRVVEDVPSGWVLTGVDGASCPEGDSSGATFGPWVDEASRDCTFNNAVPTPPSVSITKVADAEGNFDISLEPCNAWFIVCFSWGSPVSGGPSSWSDGTTHEFTDLPSASADLYRVVEDFEDGWRLTDITCEGGTNFPLFVDLALSVNGLAFVLDEDEPTRDCTFTNTLNRIDVTKVSDPTGAPRDFTAQVERCDFNIFASCHSDDWSDITGSPFDITPGDAATEFTGVPATLFDRYYRVHEPDLDDDWTASVECEGSFHHHGDKFADGDDFTGGDDPEVTNGAAFLFSLNKNTAVDADCTITNSTTTGSITVQKRTNPAGGAEFGFTLEDGDDPSMPGPQAFTLDDEGSMTFDDLFPSTGAGYTITETALPDGWTLDGVDCGSGDPTATSASDSVVIDLAAGQHVTCTFVNVNPAEPSITLTKVADESEALTGDTITYTYEVTNTGPVEVGDLTVVDDPLGPVTLDRTTLGPAGSGTDTATGTLGHVITAAGGTTVTNTAHAEGFADCNPDFQTCTATEASEASEAATQAEGFRLEVSADADLSVSVLEVVDADGLLARTGTEVRTLVAIAGALLILGASMVLAHRRRTTA